MPPKLVTLGGKVEWGFQKIAAENAIRNLMGVKGVVNDVTVASCSG
jgi:osmotically-inducible protein OsmY